MGRFVQARPDQLFFSKPECKIKFDVLAENPLGKKKGGGIVPKIIGLKENIFEIIQKQKHGEKQQMVVGTYQTGV